MKDSGLRVKILLMTNLRPRTRMRHPILLRHFRILQPDFTDFRIQHVDLLGAPTVSDPDLGCNNVYE